MTQDLTEQAPKNKATQSSQRLFHAPLNKNQSMHKQEERYSTAFIPAARTHSAAPHALTKATASPTAKKQQPSIIQST